MGESGVLSLRRPRAQTLLAVVGAVLSLAFALPAAAGAASAVDVAQSRYQKLHLTQLNQMPSGHSGDYRTLADFDNELQALADAHPKLVSFQTAPNMTTQGRAVNYVEITKHVDAADGKPVFFMMGAIHGNEKPAAEVTLEFAYDVVQTAATNRKVSKLLNRVRLIVLPVTNPDGFTLNQRYSSTGIDLNRNYPFGWASGAQMGLSPGSEAENKNIMSIVQTHQVTELITNHTSEHFILYPPLELQEGDTPDTDTSVAPLAQAMTDATGGGYENKCSACDYETTGETIGWSYYATRAPSYTIEEQNLTGGNDNCSGSAPTPYDDCVAGDYGGYGPNETFQKGGVRNAFWLGLVYAALRRGHSVIRGKAPAGTKLTITKDFDLYTQPELTNLNEPYAVPTHLSSTMTVPASGHFAWGVNPSVRPNPPWRSDGLHAGPSGFLQENWTLSCKPPKGATRTAQITVDRGDVARVKRCKHR
jgi:hypothetical protein